MKIGNNTRWRLDYKTGWMMKQSGISFFSFVYTKNIRHLSFGDFRKIWKTIFFNFWQVNSNFWWMQVLKNIAFKAQYTKICSCFTLSVINCHSMWNKLFFCAKKMQHASDMNNVTLYSHLSLKSGSVILYLSDKMQGCEAVTTPSQRVVLDNRSINKSNWVLILLSI